MEAHVSGGPSSPPGLGGLSSSHSSSNCLRCAQLRLRAPSPIPIPVGVVEENLKNLESEFQTHSIHIPGSPYSHGKYVLHETKTAVKKLERHSDEEMCISMCTQIVYGVLMFACLCLTLAALLTPGWRNFKEQLNTDINALKLPAQQGIIPYACEMPNDDTRAPSTAVPGSNYCDAWWENLRTWEKVVIGCMIGAVVAEIAALAWNGFTWCACCCKKYLIHPLTPLSFLVSVLLCTAVVVYGTHNKDFFSDKKGFSWVPAAPDTKSEVGYSFWLAVVALIIAVADTVVAVVTVFFGEHWCC